MSSGSSARRLHELGVSVWLDDLSRQLLDDGTLGRYVEEHAVSGVTSNPTIFARALQGTTRYDDQIRSLLRRGPVDPRDAYFDLALADVRQAARVLADTHQRSGGRDGYVSFECTPDVAGDTDATVRQALEVRRRVPVPNLMVKVPGTAAGMVAIEELTAAGVNVNVTLLFSRPQYERAERAFHRGLLQRLGAGDEIVRIRSVASVFVSRLDAIVDGLLPENSPWRGRAAIASAQGIEARARALLRTRTWAKLRQAGGAPQRLLWASTAPKDPDYRDVMYVEALAFPDTIVTLPEPTLLAFADHGRPALVGSAPRRTARAITELERIRIDLDDISTRLLTDGVERFTKDYRQALDLIAIKLRNLAPQAAA